MRDLQVSPSPTLQITKLLVFLVAVRVVPRSSALHLEVSTHWVIVITGLDLTTFGALQNRRRNRHLPSFALESRLASTKNDMASSELDTSGHSKKYEAETSNECNPRHKGGGNCLRAGCARMRDARKPKGPHKQRKEVVEYLPRFVPSAKPCRRVQLPFYPSH